MNIFAFDYSHKFDRNTVRKALRKKNLKARKKLVDNKYETLENCFLNLKLARNSYIRKNGNK